MKIILLLMTVLTVRCIRLGEDQRTSSSLLGKTQAAHQPEKSLADYLLLRQGSNDGAWNDTRAITLDIGGRLFEAMKASGRDYLNKTEFEAVFLKWFHDHGINVTKGTTQGKYWMTRNSWIWHEMNPEGAVSVSKGEIFHWLFKFLDKNQDGIWNFEEIVDFITDQAKLLHRDLKEGWKITLKKHYDEVNYGVSARELEAALSRNGQHIGTFKDFLLAHSNARPQGKIDPLELGELFYKALDKEKADHLSKERWLTIVKEYFRLNHYHWNATTRAEAIKTFDKKDKDKSGTCSKNELFQSVFDMFDRDGDKRLSDKELKQLFEWYAKSMGRKLHDNWWDKHLEPAIREIENGVTPEELRNHLKKKNQRITDFRHAVIAVSSKEKDTEYDRFKKEEEKKRKEEESKEQGKQKKKKPEETKINEGEK